MTLSGERFSVVYHLTGTEAEARAKAADICLEQTVELPDDLLTGDIRGQIVGRVAWLRQIESGVFEAAISFARETVGGELTQLLNVIFGNISLKPGIRVERLELPESLLRSFRGPRFGRDGLRARLGVPHRPLLCTALKPMGMTAAEMAELAYQLALGGIDIIKDDHGLADQPFCPFEERVKLCADAVARANEQTGRRCVYMPNVAAPADRVLDRALFAKQTGAGGLLIAPGLTGLDTMRQIADDDRIGLPIMSHPAMQGSFVAVAQSGLSHFALFGQIARLAGADASIFPNYGGRFFFSLDECRRLADGAAVEMGHIKPIFPTPAGGMSLERVPEMRHVYGRDVIFLIGGGLRRHGPDLIENCRYFKRLVEENW
ncbi:MAG: ribulose 1,5-bisphosphate carboxylase large subunit [Chloroflexi bacterium]|nr:ribulose 1,5-bisphosphate carboxylase large subunit [Chloroflexota bacterium]